MHHRWVIVATCAIVIASIYPLYRMSGVNFTPNEDESRFQISARLPIGSSLAATQSLVDRLSRDIRAQIPGVTDVQATAGGNSFRGGGSNSGNLWVRLKPIDEREHSQQELITRTRTLMTPYRQSAVISVQGMGGLSFAGGRGSAIQYSLVGPDLKKLDDYTARALELMGKSPALVDVDRSYEPGLPELRIDIDRKRAADLDVRVQDISQTVNALIAGQEVTTFNAASDQYDVVLKAQDSFRRTPDSIASATVRAGKELVQLRNLVTFDEGSGPASIDRLNRQRQITISANPAPGIAQAEGQAALEAAFAQLDMEPGYNLVTSGQSRELGRAAYYFGVAFALSFIFMYMVLAAQFESFIHPITILLTLPLAVPFGLFSALLFRQQLNIYSALGVLLLFGIVKKNAILQIDHTLGLRAKGLERDHAIIQANRDRLRPILMTTLALVAGMMPLCIGSGPGAETNRSIGLLVAGGQSFCLLLTLLAVPVFYSLFDDAASSPAWERIGGRWSAVGHAVRRVTGRWQTARHGVVRPGSDR
jgi:HAE1 family hydrophobic/amphiphilic exporter-1